MGSDLSMIILLAAAVFFLPLILSVVLFGKIGGIQSRISKLEAINKRLFKNQKKLRNQIEELAFSAPEPDHKATPDKEKASDQQLSSEDEKRKTSPIDDKTPKPLSSVPETAEVFWKAKSDEPRKTASTASMEREAGTRWSIWLGAIALGLGAIFMVKHSIDQGYLTPAVRILFGFLMGAGLLAGGEFMRRKDLQDDIAGVPGAHIPGALTAAGIVAAFATTYAAYALYGFFNPLFAFILLAIVSIGALAFSLLHGPGLAAVGLVGSYVTPALVSTNHPSAWALFSYLAFVTLASFITAQARGWLWLAICALTGSVIWGGIWFKTNWHAGDIIPLALYIFALLASALFFLKQAEPVSPETGNAETKKQPLWSSVWIADLPVTLGMGAIALLAVALMRHNTYSSASWAVFAATTGVLLFSAWSWRSMSLLAPIAAALFAIVFSTWHFGWLIERGPSIDFVTPPALREFLIFGAAFAAAHALLGFFAVLHRNGDPVWALTSALTALLTFAYAYWRGTSFEHSLPFGFAGIALAAAATFATDRIDRISKERRFEISAGIYATAAVAALALAMTILLEKGWLTIALAAMTPALAYIARVRKMQALGILAALIAVIVAARLAYDPRIIGENLGKTPILNWLLYGYGLPAFAFALAASIFRKQRDDWVPALLEAAAILFLALLIFLQIRHYMNDGQVFSVRYDLKELSLHSLVWLSLALGYQWISERGNRFVPETAATAFGILGMASVLVGHLLIMNPLFTRDPVGRGLIFNDLLLGYFVPALLCALIFWRAVNNRPPIYAKIVGLTAFILLFAYLSLEVRLFSQGEFLSYRRSTSDAEWYSYSAVWLAYGLALLGAGIVLHQQVLRQVAMALVGLVIVKVFLSDMNNLTGFLRALSFIGLGLALVGIGWLYQRIIFPQEEGSEEARN